MVTHSKFKFVAGSLCLDFVNTVGGWLRSGREPDYADKILAEKFTAFPDLLDWAQLAGVVTLAEARRFASNDGRTLLPRAIELRQSLYRVLRSLQHGWAPPHTDLLRLNREISAAQSHRRLIGAASASERGQDRVARPLVRTWDNPHIPDRILWTVAESAAELLTSAEIASVRQCPGGDCGWMFLDTSRNHARRWCQMRICGNRAKVRRFRKE
ncbi:MAG TPA: CGNR zinc finger domain-containing protein [Bryobacteraceae bacterium]|nr:CGNR zinc finger domain-containing protein [Bryobacteraceae bacterium]